jgi:hypothetical protein
MSYIGNIPTTVAFLVDTFSGNGSTTAFTLSQAPATTSSILVAVSGVVQDPSTYSVSGTTLTFSGAPPSGTSNISVRFLGIPASGVATTAYRTVTEFTATSGQTTFSVPSYTVGYIDVYRNGVLLGSADYTATNGTTVVLNNGCTAGDLVETISFFVSSVLNAIPAVANAVTETYINDGAVTKAKMAASGAWAPAGTVIQVVNAITASQVFNATNAYVDTGLTATITPRFSTSRILVLVSQNGLYKTAGNVDSCVDIRLLRGATNVLPTNFAGAMSQTSGLTINVTAASVCYLDSPATISPTTYKTQFASRNNTASVAVQYADISTSTITLMEIAG